MQYNRQNISINSHILINTNLFLKKQKSFMMEDKDFFNLVKYGDKEKHATTRRVITFILLGSKLVL